MRGLDGLSDHTVVIRLHSPMVHPFRGYGDPWTVALSLSIGWVDT